MIKIRNAELKDAACILEIYDYYVRNTAVSFDTETPSLEEFTATMEKIKSSYPYIVAEKDGRIVGYSYAHPFVGRGAYRFSCEMTIYVDPDARKCGIGRLLYEELESRLSQMGIKNLYACIGTADVEDEYLNNNSMDFHAHFGYSLVGVFHKCGYKFGRWYNMIWMEKLIAEHT